MAIGAAVSRLGRGRLKFYLDTSAQVERHAGETTVKEAFARELAGADSATSTHVQREWRNIVHSSAVAILNACQGASVVEDVKARLRQGFGRKPGHHWLALDMICANPVSVSEIEIRAEQFLRVRADVLFELGVDQIRDGSECMLARERAQRDTRTGRWSLRTMCRRDECDCLQVAFTDCNAERISRAAEALAASAVSGHHKMARIARTAMGEEDKSRRKGKACWGSAGLGGDISISLECADDETLLATDRSFDAICPAIGVAHKLLVGTQTP